MRHRADTPRGWRAAVGDANCHLTLACSKSAQNGRRHSEPRVSAAVAAQLSPIARLHREEACWHKMDAVAASPCIGCSCCSTLAGSKTLQGRGMSAQNGRRCSEPRVSDAVAVQLLPLARLRRKKACRHKMEAITARPMWRTQFQSLWYG